MLVLCETVVSVIFARPRTRPLHMLYVMSGKTTAMVTNTMASGCPKCGIILKTRKFSCCGRDGAWFGNCADEVTEKFGHTWVEGVKTCRNRGMLVCLCCLRSMRFDDVDSVCRTHAMVQSLVRHSSARRTNHGPVCQYRLCVSQVWKHEQVRQIQLLRFWWSVVWQVRR